MCITHIVCREHTIALDMDPEDVYSKGSSCTEADVFIGQHAYTGGSRYAAAKVLCQCGFVYQSLST